MSGSRLESPDAVLVVGMYESGLEVIADQLRHLGLTGATGPLSDSMEGLTHFNDQLLAELGASWDQPPLLPRLELWDRLNHRVDDARSAFDSAFVDGSDVPPGQAQLVWADPRNSVLAPFWLRALNMSASVVLVHRHPAGVARAVAGTTSLSISEALVLWDQYNRAALSLWEELKGLIVGIESYERDPDAGVRSLGEFLRVLGVDVSEERIDLARHSFNGFGFPTGDETAMEVENRFSVLDRVLDLADLTIAVDDNAIVSEFANYYDEDYYLHYGNEGDSPYRPGEPQWTEFFSQVAGRVAEEIRPATVLDAGCALGFLVEALRERGIQAWGVDVSPWAISQVSEAIEPYCSIFSLTDEIDGQFDLVTLIEVIEHMPASVADSVIANIARHCSAVLFSSTPDGFEEPTHINVRTPDYWASLFAANGFIRDFAYDAAYLSPSAVLFRRRSATANELVLGYEQYVWREKEKSQSTLDDIMLDREDLVAKISGYAELSRVFEESNRTKAAQIEEFEGSMEELERRHRAAGLAVEAELLQREREIARLQHESDRMMTEVASVVDEITAIKATWVYRHSAGLRRLRGLW